MSTRDWPIFPDEDDLRMDERYEAQRERMEEHLERITSDDLCEECGVNLRTREYLYGDDADGNRGEWRTELYCPRCD